MLDNIYILTDIELCNRIAAKIKTVRLKQNMSQAERQERCFHLHHKAHGGRGGKELRVADPRPAHPGQTRRLRPARRGGAVEPE